jgi:TfoX/Sxy family transcriptional regulator of competence genes
MKMPKPSEDDKARFTALIPDDPRVVVKPMFGNLGAFVNGNMFMGLFGPDVGVKLPGDQAEQVVAAGGGPFGPAERPMAGYVSLPPAMTGDQTAPWVERALGYVGSLPPKKPKPPKKTAGR